MHLDIPICGGIGALVLVVGGRFFMFAYDEFKLPFSIAIIALCFLSGSWQIGQTILASRNTR